MTTLIRVFKKGFDNPRSGLTIQVRLGFVIGFHSLDALFVCGDECLLFEEMRVGFFKMGFSDYFCWILC